MKPLFLTLCFYTVISSPLSLQIRRGSPAGLCASLCACFYYNLRQSGAFVMRRLSFNVLSPSLLLFVKMCFSSPTVALSVRG